MGKIDLQVHEEIKSNARKNLCTLEKTLKKEQYLSQII